MPRTDKVRLTTIAGTKDTNSRLTQNGFHRDAQSHLHVQVNSHAFAQMHTARRDRSAMLRNPWVSTLTHHGIIPQEVIGHREPSPLVARSQLFPSSQ